MSKFNAPKTRPTVAGPIRAEQTPSGVTHEDGPGYAHDAKSELFLLAVSNFVGEDTFYEKAADRDERFRALIHRVAVEDDDWFARFVHWLRGPEANMRSASLVAALEGVKARLDANVPDSPAYDVPGVTSDRGLNRWMVDAVLRRADEPGEALGYWTGRYGRALPKPVKRGVADAVRRLYTERSLLKYDTASHAFRFGDVVDLVHPAPRLDAATWQGELFRYALDRRHGRAEASEVDRLPTVRANVSMRQLAVDHPELLLNTDTINRGGFTWEDVLSLAGGRVPKKDLWDALVSSMGYMALLRNLRNMDEAGVSDAVAAQVAAKLADPTEVAKSRQLPFRFLAAYENAPSLRWGHALDTALQASLANVPRLEGRSLVLVDTSASMTQRAFSKNSTMTPAKAAALFGVALAAAQPHGAVDLVGFANGVFRHDVPRGASVLRTAKEFTDRTGEVGHGTQIVESLRATYRDHARVFIISDMQTFPTYPSYYHNDTVTSVVPSNVALYGFNLGGYKHTAIDAGARNRHEFGGLTDATFRLVPLLEAGRSGSWPF